jgi:hypothetical protein
MQHVTQAQTAGPNKRQLNRDCCQPSSFIESVVTELLAKSLMSFKLPRDGELTQHLEAPFVEKLWPGRSYRYPQSSAMEINEILAMPGTCGKIRVGYLGNSATANVTQFAGEIPVVRFYKNSSLHQILCTRSKYGEPIFLAAKPIFLHVKTAASYSLNLDWTFNDSGEISGTPPQNRHLRGDGLAADPGINKNQHRLT